MKIPRFMKEYANYVKREYLNGKSEDIDLLLKAYRRDMETVAEVMDILSRIEKEQSHEKHNNME